MTPSFGSVELKASHEKADFLWRHWNSDSKELAKHQKAPGAIIAANYVLDTPDELDGVLQKKTV